MRRLLLLCSAALAPFALGLVVGYVKPYPLHEIRTLLWPPPATASIADNPVYAARRPLLAAFPGTARIVMAGDSLTDLAEWQDLIPDVPIANRGISGDTSDGLLRRIPEIAETRPDKVFVMIGVNDLRYSIPVHVVVGNIATIVAKLHAANAAVFVESVLCTSPDYLPGLNARVHEVDTELAAQCSTSADGACTFIDLRPSICKDGTLPPAMSIDGIHLRPEAYVRWRDALAPYLQTAR
jgi:hexosaminidase